MALLVGLALSAFTFAHYLPGLTVVWRSEVYAAALWGSLALGLLSGFYGCFRSNGFEKPESGPYLILPLGLIAAVILINVFFTVSGVDGRSRWQNGTLNSLGLVGVAVFALNIAIYGKSRFLAGLMVIFATISLPMSLLYDAAGYTNPKERFVFVDFSFQTLKGVSLIGAAGVAALVIAGAKDMRLAGRLALVGLALGAAVAILATASRGAAIALCFAGLSLLLKSKFRKPVYLWLWLLAGYAAMGMIVFSDEVIAQLACGFGEVLCRPSLRWGIWMQSMDHIIKSPWIGYGVDYRVPKLNAEGSWGNHNGLIGIATAQGLPVLCLFLAALFAACDRINKLADEFTQRFCLAMLAFSLCYFGSNLSNPFGVNEGQYLYFLIPFFLCFAAAAKPLSEQAQRPASFR
jgi:O-antigen ligase